LSARFVLVFVGSTLQVYRSSDGILLTQSDIFSGSVKAHSFSICEAHFLTSSSIVLIAAQSVSVLIAFNENSGSFTVLCRLSFSSHDWILACALADNPPVVRDLQLVPYDAVCVDFVPDCADSAVWDNNILFSLALTSHKVVTIGVNVWSRRWFGSVVTGQEQCTLVSFAFLSNGRWQNSNPLKSSVFASGLIWNDIYVWDDIHSVHALLRGHEGSIYALQFADPQPFSSTLALVSCSDDRTVRVWALNSAFEGTCLRTIFAHSSRCWDLCVISPTTFVSAGEDAGVKLWSIDLPPGNELLAQWHDHRVINAWTVDACIVDTCSEAGSYLLIAAGGDDSTVKLYRYFRSVITSVVQVPDSSEPQHLLLAPNNNICVICKNGWSFMLDTLTRNVVCSGRPPQGKGFSAVGFHDDGIWGALYDGTFVHTDFSLRDECWKEFLLRSDDCQFLVRHELQCLDSSDTTQVKLKTDRINAIACSSATSFVAVTEHGEAWSIMRVSSSSSILQRTVRWKLSHSPLTKVCAFPTGNVRAISVATLKGTLCFVNMLREQPVVSVSKAHRGHAVHSLMHLSHLSHDTEDMILSAGDDNHVLLHLVSWDDSMLLVYPCRSLNVVGRISRVLDASFYPCPCEAERHEIVMGCHGTDLVVFDFVSHNTVCYFSILGNYV
jgi:WD40 repeat protein